MKRHLRPLEQVQRIHTLSRDPVIQADEGEGLLPVEADLRARSGGSTASDDRFPQDLTFAEIGPTAELRDNPDFCRRQLLTRLAKGIVAELALDACFPLTPPTSFHADDLSGAEGVEAVHEGDADVDFCGLAVGVSCGDALAEGLSSPAMRRGHPH